MYHFKPLAYAEPTKDGRAPAFTPEEHRVIAGWKVDSTTHDMRVEIYTELFGIFDEAILVSSREHGDQMWLIHKTPAGSVAVRLWPGLADIVETVAEALAVVQASVEVSPLTDKAGDAEYVPVLTGESRKLSDFMGLVPR